jgi:transposase
MDENEFTRIAAAECKRWSSRSLGVARALLVDGQTLSDVAAAETITIQHAYVIRSRFLNKCKQARLNEFMKRESPRPPMLLEPYKDEVRSLRDKGYSIAQIVAFLSENGVETSATTVRAFLRKKP